jgi:hypothetical protein
MLIHIAVLLNRPESRLGEGHAEKQKRASTGELDLLPQNGESQKKLLKAVREFRGYIEAKQNFIPNYGDRYRHGEKVSTAFAESAVNQVVSKRMVKKQQMRWSESGAHNLLQVRTKVLNDQLRETFVRWYPAMQTEQETEIEKKAAYPPV